MFPEFADPAKHPKDKRQLEQSATGKKRKKKQQVDITNLMFKHADDDWD